MPQVQSNRPMPHGYYIRVLNYFCADYRCREYRWRANGSDIVDKIRREARKGWEDGLSAKKCAERLASDVGDCQLSGMSFLARIQTQINFCNLT